MISAHITDDFLKKQLSKQSQELRRYIRRDYSKELKILSNGIAIHNPCISHCIRHAFGVCGLDHPITCIKCENLFYFFDKLKDALNEQYSEILDEYKQNFDI
ncbi:14229_t:CDS:2 [Gigaspora rosea]|nr:14229_t:CDS:2 [Gigaspora rosea]